MVILILRIYFFPLIELRNVDEVQLINRLINVTNYLTLLHFSSLFNAFSKCLHVSINSFIGWVMFNFYTISSPATPSSSSNCSWTRGHYRSRLVQQSLSLYAFYYNQELDVFSYQRKKISELHLWEFSLKIL